MNTQLFPIFLPNKGIVLDKPEEFINQSFSVDGTVNFEFDDELVRGRLGLEKFNTGALSGVVNLIDQYWKLDNTWNLMFCTPKDIYKYDFSNTRFDILTPVYTTGNLTIASTGSAVACIGSDTTWSTNLKSGDYMKVGSGGYNTEETWFQVHAVSDDTGCTLLAVTTTCAAADYVGRNTFGGSDTDFWRSTIFQDKALGSVWVGTNGVNNPIYYSGSGQVENVTGLPSSMTAASYVASFKDRVIWGDTVEGGSNESQRARWSYIANLTGYSASDFHDFVDEETYISGFGVLGNYIAVFKEKEGYIGRWIGGNYIFDFEKSNSCVGTPSQNSVVKAEHRLYYYGSDNTFHRWDLIRDDDVTPFQTTDIKDFSPNLELYTYGYHVPHKKQIRWFCPTSIATSYNDLTVVHNYEEGINNHWEYEQTAAACCIGSYLNTADLYVDDVDWKNEYVDEHVGYWDDRTFLDNAETILYGGYDKYIRKADIGTKDDGLTYTRTFKTAKLNFGTPDADKRLKTQQWWFDSENAGEGVKIEMYKGDNTVAETKTHSFSISSSSLDTIKKDITWNKEDINFQFELTSTGHVALLGFLNYIIQR